jgi:trans-aconitate methyltransferase
MTSDRKAHWEKIYRTKEFSEFSWYQEHPDASLDFLAQFNISKTASIIDVGGGDSYFVDHLLDRGYQKITVLDISETAISRAQKRLGKKADAVKWIVADVTNFASTESYDFWHDRAAFHFLTEDQDIEQYIEAVQTSLAPNGVLVLGTFSENGPEKCSGVQIRQYSEASMADRLKRFFRKIRCITVDHVTPFDTIQNFIFCSFRRLPSAVIGT